MKADSCRLLWRFGSTPDSCVMCSNRLIMCRAHNLLSPSEHRWHLCAPVAIRTGRTPTCLWWTERASEVHRVSQLTSTRGGPLGLHFTVRERLAMASSFCLLSRCLSIACLLLRCRSSSFPKLGSLPLQSIALRRFSQLRFSLELVQTLKREPRLAPWFDWRLDCRSPAPEGIYRIILPEAAVGSDTPPRDECAK